MSLQHIDWMTIFGWPDSHITILTSCNNFFIRISPGNQTTAGSSLETSDLFGEALSFNTTKIENCNGTILGSSN